jgi:hypothetical protein
MSWTQGRGIAWGVAAAAGCAIGVAGLLIPAREVVYSSELTEFGCFDTPAGRGCTAWMRLSVGNTGNVEQDVVHVYLPAAASRWLISTRVFDIRASAERRPDPFILEQRTPQSIVYQIRPLPRNTVVDFAVQCPFCAAEDVRAMRTSEIRVEAAAPVREGDPRALTLLRALGAALAFLLPRG